MNRLQTITGAVLIMAAALFLSNCNKEGSPRSESVPKVRVKAEKIAAAAQLSTESVPGNLRARTRATIEAKVAGRISLVPISEGEVVEANTLLALLDVKEISSKLDQALAVKKQAERDLARYKTLLAQRAVAQAEYDGMEAKAHVADAAVEEAQTMLGYAKVTAPFSGVITRKLANSGDFAAPGKPLFELEDPTTLRFEAALPETFLPKVRIGQDLSIEVGGRDLKGTVSEIAPIADPNSRTFLVKLDLADSSSLRAGQYGKVMVPLSQDPEIWIPKTALVTRGQMELVFVVNDGKAFMRLVRTGKKNSDTVQILSGLSSKEILVTEGAEKLHDATPVEVQ